jgi:hypothetical protein
MQWRKSGYKRRKEEEKEKNSAPEGERRGDGVRR